MAWSSAYHSTPFYPRVRYCLEIMFSVTPASTARKNMDFLRHRLYSKHIPPILYEPACMSSRAVPTTCTRSSNPSPLSRQVPTLMDPSLLMPETAALSPSVCMAQLTFHLRICEFSANEAVFGPLDSTRPCPILFLYVTPAIDRQATPLPKLSTTNISRSFNTHIQVDFFDIEDLDPSPILHIHDTSSGLSACCVQGSHMDLTSRPRPQVGLASYTYKWWVW
jgi:hypothetical protein